MARWTTADIPPLTGRTAVVTGANSGLGFEAALALAQAGARTVLACRDQTRGLDALDRIRRQAPAADVTLSPLDLADLASVRTFATAFSSAYEGLDILMNNAGLMAIPRSETVDGFEMQVGVNHLGHFALTGLLLARLLARPGARVVTVSSEVAKIGRLNLADFRTPRRYGKWTAYAQSKLANQLFTLELDRRARARERALISVGAHPGYAATNLQAVGPRQSGSRLMATMAHLGNVTVAQSAADGALPVLYGATAGEVRGGQYFGPDRLFGMRGHPKAVAFTRRARDPETARRLWEVSEDLTGVRFAALDA